jgi:hypothetical protein
MKYSMQFKENGGCDLTDKECPERCAEILWRNMNEEGGLKRASLMINNCFGVCSNRMAQGNTGKRREGFPIVAIGHSKSNGHDSNTRKSTDTSKSTNCTDETNVAMIRELLAFATSSRIDSADPSRWIRELVPCQTRLISSERNSNIS